MPNSTHGVIAAGHAKTAEAGLEMLRLGGNAFDAAIAAVMAAFVVEPTLTSPAGGGFLLAHTSQQEDILFDFFTQTPGSKKAQSALDFYPVDVNFGGAIQEFHIGLGSMGVPGNVAGIFHVHQRLGRLPFQAIAEPAIHYAKNGVEISDFQYFCFQILSPILTASAESRQIFAPDGPLVALGTNLVMPDLAETLAYLAKTGPKGFYQGDIAHQIAQDCENFGGYLTLEDLQQYQVIERRPLTINYRDNILLTNPTPSSGGTLIAFALELLSAIDLTAFEFGSAQHLDLLATTMRLTNAARREQSHQLFQQDSQAFLDGAQVEVYQAQLSNAVNKWGSTTHLSVIDDEGNAASVTTSNGEGCGYIVPGTGIMMNNMLGEEDLNPNGFHQWQENTRIASMMAPTIVLKDQQPEIVLGSGGSNRIRTAILQVISNILDFQMPVAAAVESPRIHWENSVFNVEPGFSEAELSKLHLPPDDERVLWQQENMFFGGVHTVIRDADGTITGAGDRRRSGVVMSC
ncbi:gamma-glutamyltransferase [Trichocoleus desertorum AS-A10]|uniref:gamma-glutamyltransferase n=1 Tax=Trichocoleus desertorum TaxID=1481672 RepID=UPI0032978133